ncbi:hypothetical protein RSOLAG1IB_01573 [Rhizoctonia solani AG-1 IB]|uniref:Uncharacterized protein n=1 Tax=Thanatephorus cucumeris (strain AG1-IB / isolate 7/3/14) TaxID=1108050 RepID=A0A0B7FC29_THACB|nr:hypothetical protein RSOLAG1IB_01573 [Rhizoctonia solani AG-1 IB]
MWSVHVQMSHFISQCCLTAAAKQNRTSQPIGSSNKTKTASSSIHVYDIVTNHSLPYSRYRYDWVSSRPVDWIRSCFRPPMINSLGASSSPYEITWNRFYPT